MKPRRFLFLAGLTALTTAAAVGAYLDRSAGLSGAFLDEPLLPELSGQLNDVIEIAVESPDETFTLQKTDEGWVLPGKFGYRVLDTLPRPFLIGLGGLEVRERKTANPERHHRLDLRDREIPGSAATRITLKDAEGDVLADLLFGGGKPGPGDQAPYHYVRLAGDDQAWLAQADVTIRPTVREWIDRGLINIPRKEVIQVKITPASGPAFTVQRKGKGLTDNPTFTIADLSEEEAIARSADVNALASALARLIHDDVRPDDGTFQEVARATFTLEDDAEAKVILGRGDGGKLWARFAFRGNSERAEEARRITDGWLYDLGPSVNDRIVKGRASYIE